MEALLATYSAGEILTFVVLLFIAAKEFLSVINYFKDQGMSWFTAVKEKENHKVSLSSLWEKIDKIEKTVNLLSESDKDDIKSWLVEKYNYYIAHPKTKISEHTMDTIEKRYSHYKAEGGNSYIDNSILPELRRMMKEEQRVEL